MSVSVAVSEDSASRRLTTARGSISTWIFMGNLLLGLGCVVSELETESSGEECFKCFTDGWADALRCVDNRGNTEACWEGYFPEEK